MPRYSLSRDETPSTTFGEKEGMTTNSERTLSRQRKFMDNPGDSQNDWWLICQVARRMGFRGFEYSSPVEIFREFAGLSAIAREEGKVFDISGLAGMTHKQYESFTPKQWPLPTSTRGSSRRLFIHGVFPTPSGKARLEPTPFSHLDHSSSLSPLQLNTGRVRDHWHTMTRTSRSPRLNVQEKEPFVEVHPKDVEQYLGNYSPTGYVRVGNHCGEVLARLRVSEKQKQGSVFVPFHWTRCFGNQTVINRLVGSEKDPVSGQPAFKGGWCYIKPYRSLLQGLILMRGEMDTDGLDHWVKYPYTNYNCYEFSFEKESPIGNYLIDNLAGGNCALDEYFPIPPGGDHIRSFGRGFFRNAHFLGSRLQSCLFLSHHGGLPDGSSLGGFFSKDIVTDKERASLLC